MQAELIKIRKRSGNKRCSTMVNQTVSYTFKLWPFMKPSTHNQHGYDNIQSTFTFPHSPQETVNISRNAASTFRFRMCRNHLQRYVTPWRQLLSPPHILGIVVYQDPFSTYRTDDNRMALSRDYMEDVAIPSTWIAAAIRTFGGPYEMLRYRATKSHQCSIFPPLFFNCLMQPSWLSCLSA